MRCYLALALIPWSAFGLTLQPMLKDDIATHSHYEARYSVKNHNEYYQEFDYWIVHVDTAEELESGVFGVAGGSSHQFTASISDINPDKKEVYRVCVQEKPKEGMQVALRNCARLRLYWPRSILSRQ